MPELLVTFGLSYVISEFVQLIWGRAPVDYRIPPSLDGPLFTIYTSTFPTYRVFMMAIAVLMLLAVWLLFTRTRVGLVIQGALSHPEMVEALGHDVPTVFMTVFGGGCALAGLAGVIGGNAFVTEPGMALTVGSIIFVVVVVGGMGSLAGAFIASLLIGIVQTFAIALDDSFVTLLAPSRRRDDARYVRLSGAEADDRAGRADPAVPAAGADPDLPAARAARQARGLTNDRRVEPAGTIRFAPLDIGQWSMWIGFGLVLLVAPLVFRSSLSLTILSQIGTVIIVCLSYNMLLGQSGMLSFGHAVYVGLGAFIAIHAINAVGRGAFWLPTSLMPLVGGLAGAFFAVLFGYVTTKKSGTTFAMITLGIGELVASSSLMLPEFFGGEAGITTNRVIGKPVLGITFGPQIQVYYLIAAWCLLCTIAMYAFTRTPLGRMANAVRDNPERAEFVGYDTQRVRYLVVILAGFFAGIAGGLGAINFEIVSSENVSTVRSGAYLLFTFLGGVGFFVGPIIGAVLFVLSFVVLSELTKAWLLYLGIFFLVMVMYAPGGIASLVLMNLRVARFGRFRRLAVPYLAVVAAALPLFLGIVSLIEMIYHYQLESANGTTRTLFGLVVDTATPTPWVVAAVLVAVGAIAMRFATRRFRRAWDGAQAEIQAQLERAAA